MDLLPPPSPPPSSQFSFLLSPPNPPSSSQSSSLLPKAGSYLLETKRGFDYLYKAAEESPPLIIPTTRMQVSGQRDGDEREGREKERDEKEGRNQDVTSKGGKVCFHRLFGAKKKYLYISPVPKLHIYFFIRVGEIELDSSSKLSFPSELLFISFIMFFISWIEIRSGCKAVSVSSLKVNCEESRGRRCYVWGLVRSNLGRVSVISSFRGHH